MFDKSFLDNIYGWCEFQSFYREMAERFPDGSKFVEIGVYEGKSFCSLGADLIEFGKHNSEIIAIDVFGWEDVFEKFKKNIANFDEKLKSRYIKGMSLDIAKQFEDNSLDFVFVDANHEYPHVLNDILAWKPKIKSGGVMAGHDIGRDDYRPYLGVKQSVEEVFGDKWKIIPNDVWMAEIQ